MGTPLDCQRCGACCFSALATYVRVTGDDHERLGDAAETLTVFVGNRCYMRMEPVGHCAALAIEADGRFACKVYEVRPEVCRELERGSPACEAEQVLKARRSGRALPLYASLPVTQGTSSGRDL